MKRLISTPPPLTKMGLSTIKKRNLSEKDKDFERSAHKIILSSLMILEVIEDIYVPVEAEKQKELLIKLCEDAVDCTTGTHALKFKFNSTNYLQALSSEIENMIRIYFGEGPLIQAFVMIGTYFIALDDRQKNVLNRIINEEGEYIYDLIKYLDFALGHKISFDQVREFSKKVTSLILMNYKSMYSDV